MLEFNLKRGTREAEPPGSERNVETRQEGEGTGHVPRPSERERRDQEQN